MYGGFILLNCDLGAEEYVLEELKRMPSIKNAYLTFGAYDIIAEVNSKDLTAFEKAVAGIRKLSRVESTMTLSITDPK
jgi:DNA-binding Lrp family transcriptional regulator